MSGYPAHFRMNGVEITTPGQFCHQFDPADLLRCRHMASGFLLRRMAEVSPWHCYHSEVFFKAVWLWDQAPVGCGLPKAENGVTLYPFSSDFFEEWRQMDPVDGRMTTQSRRCRIHRPETYARLASVMRSVTALPHSDAWCRAADDLFDRLPDLCISTARQAWAAAAALTRLTEEERTRIFLLLTAGWLLSERSPEECPAQPEALYRAWTQAPATDADRPVMAKDGSLTFAGRQAPYVLEPVPANAATGGGLRPIRLQKLRWAPSCTGSQTVSAHILLGGRQLTLAPGEYGYAAYLEGDNSRFIGLYPLQKTCAGWTIRRVRDTVTLLREGKAVGIVPVAGRDIVDMAVDAAGRYILLEPGRLDLSGYLHQPGQPPLQTKAIVQTDIRDGAVYQLNEKGHVFINGNRDAERPFAIWL